MEEKRTTFSGRIGYILAAAGSAVGLGNIWRFPYLAAKFGGGIFILVYIILVLTFGYALLISESSMGRMTGKGPIGTYREFTKDKKSFMKTIGWGGVLNALAPLIITPYYCVIGGWVTKYCVAAVCNPIAKFSKDSIVQLADGTSTTFASNYFGSFISSTAEPIIYFAIFTALLVVIVAMGVEKGIERFNKILMPMLVVMCLGLSIYCCSLPNAIQGIKYFLYPDVSKFSYMTVISAMGQLFFSLSIAMGISFTYGSYMRKEDDLIANVNHVQLFDTGVALLAGLMIIPAVVAFGGEEAASNAGPGLVFCIMPQVFATFAGGQICAIIFFILVLFAAATSAISLLETNVQTLGQELNIPRKRALAYAVAEVVVVGVLTALGYSVLSDCCPLSFIKTCQGMQILDCLDFVSNNVVMPIAAIFTTMLVTVVIGIDKFCQATECAGKRWYRKWIYQFCMSLIVIPCLLVIFLNAIGILK